MTHDESMHVAPLLDAVRARGFAPATVAMDMGYDNNCVYAECAERDCAAIIPLCRNQGERDVRIPRGSDEWRSLYRRRSSVEREFGNLSGQRSSSIAARRFNMFSRTRLASFRASTSSGVRSRFKRNRVSNRFTMPEIVEHSFRPFRQSLLGADSGGLQRKQTSAPNPQTSSRNGSTMPPTARTSGGGEIRTLDPPNDG